MRILFAAACFVLCLASPGRAQDQGQDPRDWPRWRGAAGDGISQAVHLPTHWQPGENIAWKTKVPGVGHSSPVVRDDAVYVTSYIEATNERVLLRLDRATGGVAWQQTVLVAPPERIHRLNSRASSTPAVVEDRVFVSFLDEDEMFVAALTPDGETLWTARPGPFSSRHGYCSNPVPYRDWLFVNGDHDGESYIVMLRQSDGSVVWKTPREHKTRSYNTPIIVNVDGRDQIVLNGSYVTAGFDAETGKRIWVCDGPSEQMVATIVHGHGLLFSLGGYPERHLLAIRPGGKGDVTESHIVWRYSRGIPYVPSPLLYGDYLHVVSDEGIYTCFEPTTGKVLARERASKHVSSSIVGGAGRVYLTDDAGTTLVFENGPDFEVVATNSVGENVYSTPALTEGAIFLRGEEHLFCIGTPGVAAGE